MKDSLEEMIEEIHPVEKMIWIEKNERKLSRIRYDFQMTRHLTEEATKRVEEIFDEMAREDNRRPKSVLPVPGLGSSQWVRLEVCEYYLPELKSIVLNEKNWE